MATSMGRNCVSLLWARKLQITTSLSLQNSRQILTSLAPVLTVVPARCKTPPDFFKRARRKKNRFSKEDKKRLDIAEQHKNDSRAAIMYAMRHAGMKLGQPDMSRPVTITCTADVFEAYVPPEGDGKATSLTPEGAKQRMDRVKNAGKAHIHMRKIRRYEPEYTNSEFAWKAQQMFIDAHKALEEWDKNLMHSLLTEKAYPEMTWGNQYRTVRWKFLESIEKPKVVHIRCTDMLDKGNTYGQVTVRMHSKQTVAIYDRFGRLMIGNEDEPKDVLEYVVFERHLPNRNGAWRIHAKVVPPWAQKHEAIVKTMVLPTESEEDAGTDVDVKKEEVAQQS